MRFVCHLISAIWYLVAIDDCIKEEQALQFKNPSLIAI